MTDDPQGVSEYDRWKAQQGSSSEYDQWKAGQSTHRPLNKQQLQRLATSQGEKNAADLSTGERVYNAMLPEAPVKKFLGAAALPLQGLPGGEALQAKIGANTSGTDYRSALRAQRETTDRIGPGGQMLLKGIGGVAGMAIPGVGALMSNPLGQAAIGALYGASDADPDQSGEERALRGGTGAIAAPLIGWGAGAAMKTNLAAKVGGQLATMLKDSPNMMKILGALTPTAAATTGREVATPVASQGLKDALASMEQWGKLSSPQRAGVRRLAGAADSDTKAGLAGAAPFQGRPGMPETMGVDVAGPHVLEEARGAARSTAGRAALEAPFQAREAQAIPSITTGIDDAMAQRYSMAQARQVQAKAGMESALEATTGKPIDLTDDLKEVLHTPAGRAAKKSAIRSRLNAPERPLPEVPVKAEGQVEGFEPTEFIPPGQGKTQTGLDAEALHLVTRALRRAAQGEAGQAKPMGKAASDAIASGELRSQILPHLPPEFQQFMDDYRAASQDISALDLGRTKSPLNPTGLGKAEKSLTDVERTVKRMGPSEQDAFRSGKQFDLASRLRSGQSVESMASDMAIPGGQGQREGALSGSAIPARVQAWNKVLGTQKGLVSGSGPARVRTAEGIGMDIVAPTLGWTEVRTLRQLFGKLSDKARFTQGMEDAEFNRLLLKTAPNYRQALAAAKTPGARANVVRTLAAMMEAQNKNVSNIGTQRAASSLSVPVTMP